MSNQINLLNALSPVDGRYRAKTKDLAPFLSELGLIKYRLLVELKYLLFLKRLGLPQLIKLDDAVVHQLIDDAKSLSAVEAQKIKDIEKTTNHDVKAVEYYIKDKLSEKGQQEFIEFVHFGLTSQDINNTAIPLSFKEALAQVMHPELLSLIDEIKKFARPFKNVTLLSRTHGQPASPSKLGKELNVFSSRLEDQLPMLYNVPFRAKFGGATGNYNAHTVAYPEINWAESADEFVEKTLGLTRTQLTTQIEPYDMLAAHCHAYIRINNICIDFCRDVWTYISMEYFTQRVLKNEVGSSAMPHKVNPIDFENAEGNLGVANSIFQHLASKLPISRLQRDLTDSTVLRNLGVPLAHSLIAYKSMRRGLSKLQVNLGGISRDLDSNWAVLSEAIQTILRREGFQKPYELLKDLSRGNQAIDQASIHQFIHQLDVSDAIKAELLALTPENYVGQ